jgi:hypothetical protein
MADESWHCPACCHDSYLVVVCGSDVKLRCCHCSTDGYPGPRSVQLIVVPDPLSRRS